MNTAEDMSMQVPLPRLLEGLVALPEPLPVELSVEVSGVKMDSRQLKEGELFIACFGQNHDARDYIDQAIDVGIAAVLAQAGDQWQDIQYQKGVPIVAVDNLPARISEIAGRFYDHPSRRLDVLGITGTNGKTSCSQFIAQLLDDCGRHCGVIGTLGYGRLGSLEPTLHTTPDAVFTQLALAEFCKQGLDSVAMEVSSLGLHQHRVAAIEFDTAIFTNLSRDHLDYHKSMASYAENKRKLFGYSSLKSAVINLDDDCALTMMDAVGRGVNVLTYSTVKKSAAVYADELRLDRHGFRASIHTPFGEGEIECRLFGRFNVSNVLAAMTAAMDYLNRSGQLDLQALMRSVSDLKPVHGRMELTGSSDEMTCIVDYAHTPEGLRSALTAVRDHFSGNVWCVFGCGGNRDMGKRPIMGEIAESLADRLVITDDNPRNEDGQEIVGQILSGIENPKPVSIIRDRASAIEYAVENALPGDIVLVAGKGHESYQDVGGVRTLFSDVNQARLALQKRGESARQEGPQA